MEELITTSLLSLRTGGLPGTCPGSECVADLICIFKNKPVDYAINNQRTSLSVRLELTGMPKKA